MGQQHELKLLGFLLPPFSQTLNNTSSLPHLNGTGCASAQWLVSALCCLCSGGQRQEDLCSSGVTIMNQDFTCALETLQDAHSKAIGAPKVTYTPHKIFFFLVLFHFYFVSFLTFHLLLKKSRLMGTCQNNGILIYGFLWKPLWLQIVHIQSGLFLQSIWRSIFSARPVLFTSHWVKNLWYVIHVLFVFTCWGLSWL